MTTLQNFLFPVFALVLVLFLACGADVGSSAAEAPGTKHVAGWMESKAKAVARLVKQAAADAGLDPERYSGHSLRAGLATAAGDQCPVSPN